MQLKTKILALTLLVTLLPLFVLSLVWGWYADRQVETLVYQKDQRLLQDAIGPLDEYLTGLQLEIGILASTPLIQSLDWSRIQPFLDDRIKTRPNRFGKYIIGLSDATYYSSAIPGNSDQGGLVTEDDRTANAAPKRLTARKYWQETVRDNPTGESRLMISEPLYSYSNDVSQIMIAAAIISSSGEVLGVVGGAVEWRQVQAKLDQISTSLQDRLSDSSKVALVYKDGSYAYHWRKESRSPQRPAAASDNSQPSPTPIRQDLPNTSRSVVNKILAGETGVDWFIDPASNQKTMLLYEPLRNTGYSVVFYESTEDYFDPLDSFRSKTYVVFLIALLLTIPLVYVLIRSIFNPVERLRLFTKAMTDGKPTQLIPSAGNNEISRLERDLAMMAATLVSREARIKAVINSAVDGVITVDAQGRVIEWNLAAEKLFGYCRAEMLGQELTHIIPPKHFQAHRSGLNKAAEASHSIDPAPTEVEAIHANGTRLQIELTLSRWHDESRPLFTGIVRDVHERKRYEILLEKLSDRLAGKTGKDYIEQLVLGLADAYQARYALIGLIDDTGQSISTVAVCGDGQVVENIRYPLSGSPCAEVIDGQLCEADLRVISEGVQQRYPADRLLQQMGIESYSGTAIHDEQQQNIGLIAVMDSQPMTDESTKRSILKLYAGRVATELERMDYEKSLRLAAIAFDTLEGITVTDAQANILRVNRAFTEITGYSEAEVIGKNPRMLQSSRQDSAFYRDLWSHLMEHGCWQGELWNRHKSGEEYPQWLCINAAKDDAGITTNYIATFLNTREGNLQKQEIKRRSAEELVIGEILHNGLQAIDLQSFLNRAIDALVNKTPWISDGYRSAIFLVKQRAGEPVLERVASACNDQQFAHCHQVRLGQCVCGAAALWNRPQFSAQSCQGPDGQALPEPQSVYALPILDNDQQQGVLQIGLPTGHQRQLHEEQFLVRVADALSLGITKRQADDKLAYQAYHDALTGLGNRVMLEDRVSQALLETRRRQQHIGLIFIDLDHFKSINDALGHGVGDQLLQEVSQRMQQCVRAEDTISRIGGDEFVVLLPQLGDDELAAADAINQVAQKILTQITACYLINHAELRINGSIGVVVAPPGNSSFESLLKHADTAMYRAKASGRGCIRFFEHSMQEAVDKRLELEHDLRHAVENNDFHLVYQPQVDADGVLLSAEALIRWHKPGTGIVSPLEFIPVAEETGLILPIGHWVIRSACQFIARLNQQDEFYGHISVNVSARQFRQSGFIDELQQILDDTGIHPYQLGIELTESLLVEDIERVRALMLRIRTMGILISIDDFGTGYSALSYLKTLPIDVLKIDRAFVKEVHADKSSAAIAEAILAMSKNLEMDVVAEGVETEAELAFLTQRGCRVFQGYYFSKPLTESDFLNYRIDSQQPSASVVTERVVTESERP